MEVPSHRRTKPGRLLFQFAFRSKAARQLRKVHVVLCSRHRLTSPTQEGHGSATSFKCLQLPSEHTAGVRLVPVQSLRNRPTLAPCTQVTSALSEEAGIRNHMGWHSALQRQCSLPLTSSASRAPPTPRHTNVERTSKRPVPQVRPTCPTGTSLQRPWA